MDQNTPLSHKTNLLYFNKPNIYGKENVDHFNININANNQLGKVLDLDYIKVIQYPHIGKFSSVRSLWHWLLSPEKDDKVRKMVRGELHAHVKKNKLYGRLIPNLKAIIGYATWLKLKEYPELLKELKELDDNKPILSYYTVKANNLRIATSYAKIIIEVTKLIQKALRENTVPDFFPLTDRGHSAALHFLEPYLKTKLEPYEIEQLKDLESLTGNDHVEYELPEPEVVSA